MYHYILSKNYQKETMYIERSPDSEKVPFSPNVVHVHVMCQLLFGVAVAPVEWCVWFEVYIDLIIELLASLDWDSAALLTPETPYTPSNLL